MHTYVYKQTAPGECEHEIGCCGALGNLKRTPNAPACVSLSCRYHLRDVVVGKIYFLLVRIKIKHMELSIIKRETSGSGANMYNENETLVKHEIMDGAPVRGVYFR